MSGKRLTSILEVQALTDALEPKGKPKFLRVDGEGNYYVGNRRVSPAQAVQWYARNFHPAGNVEAFHDDPDALRALLLSVASRAR